MLEWQFSFAEGELSQIQEDAQYAAGRAQEIALEELAKAPTLDADEAFYWNCFNDLNTCRDSGMGVTSISILDMLRYAEFYEFTREEAYELVDVIRRVDDAFVRLCNKKEAGKR